MVSKERPVEDEVVQHEAEVETEHSREWERKRKRTEAEVRKEIVNNFVSEKAYLIWKDKL